MVLNKWLILFIVFFVLIGWEPISIQGIIKMVFPFLIPRHNYTTTYIMLYMSIPFINKFISSLSKKKYTVFNSLVISYIDFYSEYNGTIYRVDE